MQAHKISMTVLRQYQDEVTLGYQDSMSDPKSLLKRILSDLDGDRIDEGGKALKSYYRVIRILELDGELGLMKEPDRQQLKRLAEHCLRYCGINPITSIHAHLYRRLYLLFAEHRLRSGSAWESFGLSLVGDHLGRDGRDEQSRGLLVKAVQAYRLGNLRFAQEILKPLSFDQTLNRGDRTLSLILLARSQRLGQSFMEARQTLMTLAPDVSSSLQIAFELCLCDVSEARNAQALGEFLKCHQQQLESETLQIGQLWLYASRNRGLTRLLSLQQKSKVSSVDVGLLSRRKTLNGMISILERLHDLTLSFSHRLELLGVALADKQWSDDPELALLFFASATRWLYRVKQKQAASLLLDEYHFLSLRSTSGQTKDALGLLADIEASLQMPGTHPVS